jgi:hypothetical protein
MNCTYLATKYLKKKKTEDSDPSSLVVLGTHFRKKEGTEQKLNQHVVATA